MSPIMARPNAELGKDHIPPQMHVAPKPDLTVEAKPRTTRSPEQPQQRTVNRLPLDTVQPPNRGSNGRRHNVSPGANDRHPNRGLNPKLIGRPRIRQPVHHRRVRTRRNTSKKGNS